MDMYESSSDREIGAWLRDSQFGWRGKIGAIIPSTGITFDYEWSRMLPKGTSFHVTRVLLERATIESLDEMSAAIPAAVNLLRTADVQVICYGCTIGSLYRGVSGEEQLSNAMRTIVDVPVVTMAKSAADAMRELGMKRVVVANPYTDEINVLVRNYLEENDFDIVSLFSRPVSSSRHIADLSLQDVVSMASNAISNARNVDGIFLSCGNMRTVDAIDEIERKTGLPVVSSNQALIWSALRAIRVREPVHGFGTLLSKER